MNSSPTPAPMTNGHGKKVDPRAFFSDTQQARDKKKQAALESAAWNKGIKLPAQQSSNAKPRGLQPQIVMPTAPGKDTRMATGSHEDDKTDIADDATDIADLEDFEEWEEVPIPGPSSEPTTDFKTPSRPGQEQKRNGLVRQGAITPETYQQFSSPSSSGPFSTAPLPSLLEKLAATATAASPEEELEDEDDEDDEDEEEDDELDRELERQLELELEPVVLPSDEDVNNLIASALNMMASIPQLQQPHAAEQPAGQAASNLQSQITAAPHPKFERTTPGLEMEAADASSVMQVQETPSVQERARSNSAMFPSGPGFSSTAGSTFRKVSSAQTGSTWGTGSSQQPAQATTTTTNIPFAHRMENDLKKYGFGIDRATPSYLAKGTTAWSSAPDHQPPSQSAAPNLPTQEAQIQAPKEASQEAKSRFQFQPQSPSSTVSQPQQQLQTTTSTPDTDVDMTSVAPPSTFSFNSAYSFSTAGGFSVNPASSKPAAAIAAPNALANVASSSAPSSSTTTSWTPSTQNNFAFKATPSTSTTAVANSNTQNNNVFKAAAPSTSTAAVTNPNTQSNFAFKAAPSTSTAPIANPTTQNSVTPNGTPSVLAATGWNPTTQNTNNVAFNPAPSTSAVAIREPNPQTSFAAQQAPAPPPRVLTKLERSNLWWDEMATRVAFDEEQKRLREAKAREEAAEMKAPAKPAPFALVTGSEDKGKKVDLEVKGVRVRPSEIIPGKTASEYHKKIVEGEEAFDKRKNAGGSPSSLEKGKSETKADEWRRYNAMMDKKDEERKKRRFEESFNGTRKRRYYLAGDAELEESIAANHHTLSPRVAHHQLYPADDVVASPLPVSHPVHSPSLPMSAFEDQGDGWVNPEWLNEGQPNARKVIGLRRSLKAMASGIFDTVKGKLKAIWEQAPGMKKAQATGTWFVVSEQELTRLNLSYEEYQTLARKAYSNLGFQLPQGPVVLFDEDDDDEEDGDYIDDSDSQSAASLFTGSDSDDL